MNIKKHLKIALAIVISITAVESCVHNDEWDTPPIVCNNKFEASNISLADFVAQTPSTGYKLIETDQIFDAYVVSSDLNGNFYKTISFQDKAENPTVGLQIEIDKSANYADFPVGSHIRINANGLRLANDRGTIKIGSVDPNYTIGRVPASIIGKYIGGVCDGNGQEVKTIIPLALNNLAEAKQAKYINMLVSVPNTQFITADLNKKYIDYDTAGIGVDTDRNIEDTTGSSTVIRTSGFSKFGATLLPEGNGVITFVVSRYNTSWQMLIRSLNDVKIPETGPRYDAAPPKGGTTIAYSGAFTENFESYTTTNLEVFPKYVNDAFLGNRYWQIKTFSGNKYIQLSANAGSGNYKTYFIVPVDFTAANSVKFDVNIGYYNGNALKVYTATSANYTPLGTVNTSSMTDITSSFTIPTTPTSGYGVLAPAGTYNLPAALTGNGFVVFEYSGGNPGVTTTIQIDNIVVN